MASDELAEKLRVVIKEDYNEEISLEQAHAMLNDAVGYFDVLARVYHESIVTKATPVVDTGLKSMITYSGAMPLFV